MDAATPFSPSPVQAEVIFAEVTLGSATLTDLAMRFNLPLCGLSDWFNSAVTVAQRQCVQTAHASAVRLAASTALCASLTRVCRRAIRPELEPPDPKDPTGARRDIRLLEILYKLCRFVPISATPPSDDLPRPRPPSSPSPFTHNSPPSSSPPPEPGPRPASTPHSPTPATPTAAAPPVPSAPSVKSAGNQTIQAISAHSASSPLSQSPTVSLAPIPSVAPPPASVTSPSSIPSSAPAGATESRAAKSRHEPIAAPIPASIAPSAPALNSAASSSQRQVPTFAPKPHS